MRTQRREAGLRLIDDLVAEGRAEFTFNEAVVLSGRSASGTSNLLTRLARDGFVERVRRGHYAVRQLGMLGTSAASEDVLLAVGAGFSKSAHRVAYRSALEELDLLSRPSRTIQVAVAKPTRSKTLSGRPLRVVLEPQRSLSVGAIKRGMTYVSDVDRALLDAAARPGLVGGAAILAEAMVAAAADVDPDRLIQYATELSWGAAIRRIGSIADALDVEGLSKKLAPIDRLTSDIELEPGAGKTAWRDSRWWVRWAQPPAELANVARQ